MLKTWILLHGALGASSQFDQLRSRFSEAYKVYTFDFYGHGGKPMLHEHFRIAHFARELREFIGSNGLHRPHVFGYSMGGYVAAVAEINNPGLLGSLVTLGTKWAWSPEIAEMEMRKLNPERIQEKVPQFAGFLADRHGVDNWANVVRNTAEMMQDLGFNPLPDGQLAGIRIPVKVLLGDSDNMVSRDESEQAASQIPGGQFHILKDTPHPFEQVKTDVLMAHLT
ncbi:MAG: alpha/beta hydrolase [Flavobacteriales bacterium]|nr:alpha/beta hydrolase [Flavobacteriales bacterium]